MTTTFFETSGKQGTVQIGKHVIDVLYYFTEKDTIYCKVIKNVNHSFKVGDKFFTHYKSLIV